MSKTPDPPSDRPVLKTLKDGPDRADQLLKELRRLRDRINNGEEDRDDPDAFLARFEELDALLSAGGNKPKAWMEKT